MIPASELSFASLVFVHASRNVETSTGANFAAIFVD